MDTTHYIGFGRRFLAYLIDITLLMATVLLITVVAALLSSSYHHITYEQQLQFVSRWMSWLSLVLPLIYFITLESSRKQATLGKMLMKIKVTNHKKERLTLLNALGRHLGKVLSMMPFGLGFLLIPFTKNKQGLHDLLAKSYVISSKSISPEEVS